MFSSEDIVTNIEGVIAEECRNWSPAAQKGDYLPQSFDFNDWRVLGSLQALIHIANGIDGKRRAFIHGFVVKDETK